MIPLSRTCHLADFPDCVTVAAWQQQLAARVWEAWQEATHVRTRAPALCINWSGCPFEAPGPTAIYQTRETPPNDVEVRRLPALYGLSVLDHVEAPVKFLSDAAKALRDGGLLFVTYAFWSAEGPDTAAGAADRRRIYDAKSQTKLIAEARRVGFAPFGGIDWTYHGHTLDDHTLASLVLIRKGVRG